jgi:hypothetical protein
LQTKPCIAKARTTLVNWYAIRTGKPALGVVSILATYMKYAEAFFMQAAIDERATP